jgi:predicted MPP superfamily phosphohydrolase
LLYLPGLYVFGSNDYYGPRLKNPFSYLKKDDGVRKLGPRLDTDHFDRQLQERGWKNLNTSRVELLIKGVSIEARGTDDAHLNLDDYSLVAGKKDPKVDISIGVTHAPYKRVLNSMAGDGLDIIFAGHTHGGQILIPWFKGSLSIVTNCDLPNSQSRGLSVLENNSLLHVSAGLGESAFAPYRFFCPREATVLTLKPKR